MAKVFNSNPKLHSAGTKIKEKSKLKKYTKSEAAFFKRRIVSEYLKLSRNGNIKYFHMTINNENSRHK